MNREEKIKELEDELKLLKLEKEVEELKAEIKRLKEQNNTIWPYTGPWTVTFGNKNRDYRNPIVTCNTNQCDCNL